jgi:hypothetical protein
MNSQSTTRISASTFDDPQPPARLLNQLVSRLQPATSYAWGPAAEPKTARFFTGNSWGPKKS